MPPEFQVQYYQIDWMDGHVQHPTEVVRMPHYRWALQQAQVRLAETLRGRRPSGNCQVSATGPFLDPECTQEGPGCNSWGLTLERAS